MPSPLTFIALLCLLLLHTIAASSASNKCSNTLNIIDSDTLNEAIAKASKEFLATRPHPFSTLNAVVLLPEIREGAQGVSQNPLGYPDKNSDIIWHRGSQNATNLVYPASCVKLAYMISAAYYCTRIKNVSHDCLDSHVRPMIMISDNLETGYVVDAITEQRNSFGITDPKDAKFIEFAEKRNFTTSLFEKRGLLGNQVLFHKTYPTNSGYDPVGTEALARRVYGMNLMNPACASSLMAEIMSGQSLVPEATQYMQHLLYHPRHSYSIFGWGMPPGTIMHTKIGNAYNNENAIAHITLPNKKKLVLAAFSDGYEASEPELNGLGRFAELVIQNIPGLLDGVPPSVIFDVDSKEFSLHGSSWKKGHALDAYTNGFYHTSQLDGSQSASWVFRVPESGLYEFSVWNPEFKDHTIVAYEVNYSNPDEKQQHTFHVNQRYNGGRWLPVADIFISSAHDVQVRVIAKATGESGSGKVVAVNAVRMSKYPDEF